MRADEPTRAPARPPAGTRVCPSKGVLAFTTMRVAMETLTSCSANQLQRAGRTRGRLQCPLSNFHQLHRCPNYMRNVDELGSLQADVHRAPGMRLCHLCHLCACVHVCTCVRACDSFVRACRRSTCTGRSCRRGARRTSLLKRRPCSTCTPCSSTRSDSQPNSTKPVRRRPIALCYPTSPCAKGVR